MSVKLKLYSKFCNSVIMDCFTLGLSQLRGAPSDLWGGGWGDFLWRIIFLVALEMQDFFWPMLVIFLVVALLHDFFSLILPCTIFFW